LGGNFGVRAIPGGTEGPNTQGKITFRGREKWDRSLLHHALKLERRGVKENREKKQRLNGIKGSVESLAIKTFPLVKK